MDIKKCKEIQKYIFDRITRDEQVISGQFKLDEIKKFINEKYLEIFYYKKINEFVILTCYLEKSNFSTIITYHEPFDSIVQVRYKNKDFIYNIAEGIYFDCFNILEKLYILNCVKKGLK